ncbi:MAG: hypothetical protein IKA69_00090 [Kiritimatiellae bacterium]|nr:hypothetical protein [Kiritimatiellia bacterium]
MKRLFVLLTLVAAGAASAEPAPPAGSATNAPAAAVAATNLPPAELAAATNAPPRKPLRPAVITAASTFYDRKEGIAVFTGKVYVDDERYQIHADKAYVSIVPTNQLRRIVAIGHVAMTNEARRAYGAKVTYNRPTGTVVLVGADDAPAKIVDESKGAGKEQTVVGSKIRFWVDAEQVEVLDASITTPTSGAGDLKKALGGGL